MHSDLGTLAFGSFSLVVALLWIAVIGLTLALPFMAWSVTRNVRGIRAQLERLNDNLESRGRTGSSGVLGI